jgi:hypothetical protein
MIDLLNKIWDWLLPVHNQLYSLIFTFVAGYIYWLFRPTVKLIWGRTNNNLHSVKTESGNVEIFCEKHYLQNVGKKPATNVDFVFSWKPDDVSVWQPREHKQNVLDGGEFSITIPFVAPKELIIIDSVYLNRKGAFVASVKCSEAMGKEVNFWTNRNFGMAFNVSALFLLIFGIAFLVQLFIGFITGTSS